MTQDILNFGEKQIRMTIINDEPWWVAKDVCDALGIKNSRHALARLDEDERDDVVLNDAMGRKQKTTVINEPGLYALISSSEKPEAKTFKRWVTHEVLPSIRKTGIYVAPSAEQSSLFDGAMGVINSLSKHVSRMDERLATIEVRQEDALNEIKRLPEPLGVLPTLSDADHINRAVRLYCKQFGTARGSFMALIYKDLLDYFDIDIIRRKKNAGWTGSTLSFAIQSGHGNRLYTLVYARLMSQLHIRKSA